MIFVAESDDTSNLSLLFASEKVINLTLDLQFLAVIAESRCKNHQDEAKIS
jgi:hypothetical protein